jgi:hypothetical protein
VRRAEHNKFVGFLKVARLKLQKNIICLFVKLFQNDGLKCKLSVE